MSGKQIRVGNKGRATLPENHTYTCENFYNGDYQLYISVLALTDEYSQLSQICHRLEKLEIIYEATIKEKEHLMKTIKHVPKKLIEQWQKEKKKIEEIHKNRKEHQLELINFNELMKTATTIYNKWLTEIKKGKIKTKNDERILYISLCQNDKHYIWDEFNEEQTTIKLKLDKLIEDAIKTGKVKIKQI